MNHLLTSLLVALLGFTTRAAAAPAAPSAASAKEIRPPVVSSSNPNLFFILADDLGYVDVNAFALRPAASDPRIEILNCVSPP